MSRILRLVFPFLTGGLLFHAGCEFAGRNRASVPENKNDIYCKGALKGLNDGSITPGEANGDQILQHTGNDTNCKEARKLAVEMSPLIKALNEERDIASLPHGGR